MKKQSSILLILATCLFAIIITGCAGSGGGGAIGPFQEKCGDLPKRTLKLRCGERNDRRREEFRKRQSFLPNTLQWQNVAYVIVRREDLS